MKKRMNYVMVAVGIVLLGAGLVLLKNGGERMVASALPYVCVGLGCGVFGHGMGNVISRRVMKNFPEARLQKEIEEKDERNVYIGAKAKARAYDMMVFVFGALMVSFALMGVETVAILLLVAAYLFVIGYGVYYRCRSEKEM